MAAEQTLNPARLTGQYLFIAVVWVLLGGAVLRWVLPTPADYSRIELLKDLTLVVLTSAMLFWVLRRWHRRWMRLHLARQGILDALPDLLFEIGPDNRYRSLHSPRMEFLVARPEQILGSRIEDTVPPAAAQTIYQALEQARKTGHSTGGVIELTVADGVRWFELAVARMPHEEGATPPCIMMSRDVTARRRAELRLLRLNALYGALSQCNQAIVHCHSEAELYATVCRDLVGLGAASMAWIGLLDEGEQQVIPAAAHGQGAAYLNEIDICIGTDKDCGRGPVSKAMQQRQPSWTQNLLKDPDARGWHRGAQRFGWAGMAALPLLREDRVIGTLVLFANVPDAFDEAARNLSTRMASDISMALDRFADQARLRRTTQELRDKDELYRMAFLTSPDAVNITRLTDGVYLDVNAGFERLSGWARGEVLGRSAVELRVWHRAHDRQRLVDALAVSGHCENLEFVFERKDGSTLTGLMSAQTLEWQGTPCVLTITRDISSLRAAQSRLHQLSAAVEQSPSSIVITDLQARVVFANVAFCRQTGYSTDELMGQPMNILKSGLTPQSAYTEMWTALNDGQSWRGELTNQRKDGSRYTELTLISPVRDDRGAMTHFVAIKEDITDRKSAEERIRTLAHYDSLTGLPNRALLQERARLALSLTQRTGASLVVMFLDLDHFKHINDTLGHGAGDRLLVEVAHRLKDVLRDEDTVSRVGGDEFILILPGADTAGATTVAEKLLESIPRPLRAGENEIAATVSIGIAQYPSDGEDMETLCRNADNAMYRAKRAGRNAYRFFSE